MTTTPVRTDPAAFLRRQVDNHHLAGWLRVALWCWSRSDDRGHARAYPGQLQAELGFSSNREVSRALRLARERGLIDQASTSDCVVVAGHGHHHCDGRHR